MPIRSRDTDAGRAGVTQANTQVPPTTPSGTANVIVYLGIYLTKSGTIAIQ